MLQLLQCIWFQPLFKRITYQGSSSTTFVAFPYITLQPGQILSQHRSPQCTWHWALDKKQVSKGMQNLDAFSWVAWVTAAWHSHHRHSSVLSCSVTADRFCGLHPVPVAVTRSIPQEKTVNIMAKGEWMPLPTPSPAPPHIKAPVMFPLSENRAGNSCAPAQ